MKTAAHRAVHVDEIMRCILVQLRDVEYSRTSCVAVALTCSQLYSPAMDVCWSRVNDIGRFKSCLPEDSCSCDLFGHDGRHETDELEIITPIYFPPHHEARCQWSRAYDLSRRVRTLNINGYQMHLLASVTVGPLLALGKPFFPNVKDLWLRIPFRYTRNILDLSNCFVQPTLLKCVLDLDTDVDGPELARFVTHLATTASQLQELRIAANSLSNRSTSQTLRDVRAVSKGRPKGWPKLQVLSIAATTVPTEMLLALSTNTCLEELTLTTSDLSCFQTMSPGSFPLLQVLRVHYKPLPRDQDSDDDGTPPGQDHRDDESACAAAVEDLSSFLQSVSSPHLEDVDISLQVERVRGTTLRAIAEVVGRCTQLRRVALSMECVQSSYGFNGFRVMDSLVEVVDFAALSPLCHLASLRSLVVDGIPIRLYRWQIEELGKAWPQLRKLKFVPPSSKLWPRIPLSLSIRDFELFPVHCPNLLELSLLFDPSHCPASRPPDLLVQRPRRRMVVDTSQTAVGSVEEARAISAFLRGIFPSCNIREPQTPGRVVVYPDTDDSDDD